MRLQLFPKKIFKNKKNHVTPDLEAWPLVTWRVEQFLSLEEKPESHQIGKTKGSDKTQTFLESSHKSHGTREAQTYTTIAKATAAQKNRSVL